MYVNLHIYICIYICIYIDICTYVYICICINRKQKTSCQSESNPTSRFFPRLLRLWTYCWCRHPHLLPHHQGLMPRCDRLILGCVCVRARQGESQLVCVSFCETAGERKETVSSCVFVLRESFGVCAYTYACCM